MKTSKIYSSIYIWHTVITVILFVLSYSNTVAQELSNGKLNFTFRPNVLVTQSAIWIEDKNGKYITTVFLTNFIGRNGGGNRTGETNIDLPDGNRLSALPVWSHKRGIVDITFGIDNYYPPAETKLSYPDDVDAISGATPSTINQNKSWQLSGLPYGRYNCYLEVNKSYDQNEYHNYSFYRGQPSLVWLTTIYVGNDPDSSKVLDYAGYGSPDGSDGIIKNPDYTITTAKNRIADLGGYRFKVVYSPSAIVNITDTPYESSKRKVFILYQNYPNPVKSQTSFSYSVLKEGWITLTIYSLLGKEVEILTNKNHEIGDYQIDYNASKIPNGIYQYKIQNGNYSSVTKTMIVSH
jgi:hypothetical protein